MASVLIVEDDENLRKILLRKLGERLSVKGAKDANEALELFEKEQQDVVLLDIKLPDADGSSLIEHFVRRGAKVIVITGYGDIRTAVECVKKGAFDFIQKPFTFDLLEMSVKKALKEKELEEENKALKDYLFGKENDYLLKTNNEKFKKVLKTADAVANTDLPVLIRGETGVGKEVLARYIHASSPRKDKPFIVVDCTAIPENLFESELFGHEKGAFTGATGRKLGLAEIANRGTLFFDEIGDMPLSLQAKLLRFVETKSFRRVGGLKDITVDVRIITATNKDLEKLVREGKFREDLYWRLNVVELEIPPLRERREDIPLLVDFFLKKYRKKIKPETMKELISYDWEGNVRELKNVIERACLLSKTPYVDEAICLKKKSVSCIEKMMERLPTLSELEKMYIAFLYEKLGGDVNKMAQVLGCSRRTVFRKLKELREGKTDLKDAPFTR
ncbi:MAG: sigma-54-dependent Fis family transcriptional regulator [Aquificae bacterium]|nr:sigma-54-dependent Fis family transcriptional regulator [Aquificota bacterium]